MITLNGEARSFPGPITLQALLEEVRLRPDGIAVALNFEVIPKSRLADTWVKDGDKVEVVHMVGGGRSPRRPKGRSINGTK